jgi:hypothetical protein
MIVSAADAALAVAYSPAKKFCMIYFNLQVFSIL